MKTLKIVVITLLTLFLWVGSAKAQEAKGGDEEVVTLTIEFKVNTDEFIRNENYYTYIKNIVPTIQSKKMLISQILLIGSASPEGNVANNIRLANKRADKIFSYISNIVPKEKIIVSNNYGWFLMKTGLDESDYTKLRATYVEIHYFKQEDEEPPKPEVKPDIPPQRDTIYCRDTVHYQTVNNIFNTYNNSTVTNNGLHAEPVFAVYNDLLSDLLLRANVGAEVYFSKMSFFVEGSFSKWKITGREYDTDMWHAGFRKYFNDNYDKFFVEAFANAGYFDTELFTDVGKIGIFYGGGIGIGWVFNLCPHWKLSPIVRFGLFERTYYADYYYTEQGQINVLFGNYQNGKVNNGANNGQSTTDTPTVINVSKTINKEFFENSYKAYYIGPTYVGISIKRDFCRNKKHLKK